jgi:hypothetical protein
MTHMSARMTLLGLSLLMSTSLVACGAAPPTVVATRATNEFSCPQDQVHIDELGGTSYRATGCGKTATYTCLGGNFGNPYSAMCTREGNITGGATNP